jgi:thiol-disulfide isomerase/thioredoxin
VGFRSDTAHLPDGFELTKARIKGPITLKIMRGDALVFDLDAPEYKNKAVLIQVMGTWCPNCLDETQYLNKLNKMKVPMTELVALCFERGSDTAMQLNNLARVKKNLGLTYPMILAGKADKKTASEVLPFMDPVLSYPTTIFLNRRHEVVGIHTGFNGPATGQAYRDQSRAFDQMLRKMMDN